MSGEIPIIEVASTLRFGITDRLVVGVAGHEHAARHFGERLGDAAHQQLAVVAQRCAAGFEQAVATGNRDKEKLETACARTQARLNDLRVTPEERHKILRGHPLLSARAMKHRWSGATPEERAVFLEATAKVAQKIKEAWENATPEQRKLLALEHPYFARKALHHAWTQATPQEKIAFLVAHPALYGELKSRWSSANATQKQWYVKNYPGVESLAAAKPWAETSTEERSAFLDANAAIADKAREAWQKMQPEMRATLVRKWLGWPLKMYQARLENAGKPMLSIKTRPTPAKGPAKPSHK